MRLKLREFRKIIREELIRIRLNEADEDDDEKDNDDDDDKDDEDEDEDDEDDDDDPPALDALLADDKDEDEDEERPKVVTGEDNPLKVKAKILKAHGALRKYLISKQPTGTQGEFKIQIHLAPGPKLPDVENEENPKFLEWKVSGTGSETFKQMLLDKTFWQNAPGMPKDVGSSEKMPFKVKLRFKLPPR